MEMAINIKAARFAFGFLEIAIIGYCIVEKLINGEFPTPLFIFGILGILIFYTMSIIPFRKDHRS